MAGRVGERGAVGAEQGVPVVAGERRRARGVVGRQEFGVEGALPGWCLEGVFEEGEEVEDARVAEVLQRCAHGGGAGAGLAQDEYAHGAGSSCRGLGGGHAEVGGWVLSGGGGWGDGGESCLRVSQLNQDEFKKSISIM